MMADPDRPGPDDVRRSPDDGSQPQRTRLPWQQPKPAVDDPGAPARVCALLDSPGYREAENDPDFLALPEARAPRLALDYLKPEIMLNRHRIDRTIVVFGSTRIPERATAQREVDAMRARCAAAPGDVDLAQRLSIATQRLENSRYYSIAREFGRLAGRSPAVGHGCPVQPHWRGGNNKLRHPGR
jgi:hypothetical protein